MSLALVLFQAAPIGSLIHILIVGAILALICYVIFWVMGYLGVPDPIRKVVTVIVVIIAIVWILSVLLPFAGVSTR